jgi:hypothetical protein
VGERGGTPPGRSPGGYKSRLPENSELPERLSEPGPAGNGLDRVTCRDRTHSHPRSSCARWELFGKWGAPGLSPAAQVFSEGKARSSVLEAGGNRHVPTRFREGHPGEAVPPPGGELTCGHLPKCREGPGREARSPQFVCGLERILGAIPGEGLWRVTLLRAFSIADYLPITCRFRTRGGASHRNVRTGQLISVGTGGSRGVPPIPPMPR